MRGHDGFIIRCANDRRAGISKNRDQLIYGGDASGGDAVSHT